MFCTSSAARNAASQPASMRGGGSQPSSRGSRPTASWERCPRRRCAGRAGSAGRARRSRPASARLAAACSGRRVGRGRRLLRPGLALAVGRGRALGDPAGRATPRRPPGCRPARAPPPPTWRASRSGAPKRSVGPPFDRDAHAVARRGRRGRAAGAAPPGAPAITRTSTGLGALAEPRRRRASRRPSPRAAACRARAAAASRRWRPRRGGRRRTRARPPGRCSRTLIIELVRQVGVDRDRLHRGERLDRALQLRLAVVERRHAHGRLAQRAADRRRVARRQPGHLHLVDAHERGVAQPRPAEPAQRRDHAARRSPPAKRGEIGSVVEGRQRAAGDRRARSRVLPRELDVAQQLHLGLEHRRRSAPARGGGPRRSAPRTSAVVAAPRFSMKFACLGLNRAPPTCRPLQPAASSSGRRCGLRRVVGVLEGGAERLDARRLRLAPAGAQVGERRPSPASGSCGASANDARATTSPGPRLERR